MNREDLLYGKNVEFWMDRAFVDVTYVAEALGCSLDEAFELMWSGAFKPEFLLGDLHVRLRDLEAYVLEQGLGKNVAGGKPAPIRGGDTGDPIIP